MKIAVAFLSLAIATTSLTPNALAEYIFTIPYAQGASLSMAQLIIVRLPVGAPTQDFQDAFNADFTDIQVKAVANANSNANSKCSKEDLGFGGGLLDLPVVIHATGILSIASIALQPDNYLFNEISLISLDLGASRMEISSTGDVIYDPYLAVTCNPASSGPMVLTVTLSRPVPEPGTLSLVGILGACLGSHGWRKRKR